MSWKLSFTIVGHLKNIFQDIKKDYNLLYADIFAFAESCLSVRDSNSSYELEGLKFHEMMTIVVMKDHTMEQLCIQK